MLAVEFPGGGVEQARPGRARVSTTILADPHGRFEREAAGRRRRARVCGRRRTDRNEPSLRARQRAPEGPAWAEIEHGRPRRVGGRGAPVL